MSAINFTYLGNRSVLNEIVCRSGQALSGKAKSVVLTSDNFLQLLAKSEILTAGSGIIHPLPLR